MTHAMMLFDLEYSKIHPTQSKNAKDENVKFNWSFSVYHVVVVFFTYYSSIGIDSCNTDDISIQSIARCNRSLSRLCF